MVVAWAVLVATCAAISAAQSTLVVVLVPDVVVVLAELAAVVVVEAVLLTVVMAEPLIREMTGRQPLSARHHRSLTQQIQQILRHLVGRRFSGHRGLRLDLGR